MNSQTLHKLLIFFHLLTSHFATDTTSFHNIILKTALFFSMSYSHHTSFLSLSSLHRLIHRHQRRVRFRTLAHRQSYALEQDFVFTDFTEWVHWTKLLCLFVMLSKPNLFFHIIKSPISTSFSSSTLLLYFFSGL